MRKSKKGSVQDLIFIGIVLLVLSFSLLIGFKIVTEWDTQIQNEVNFDDTTKATSSTIKGHFNGIMDKVVLFLLIGLAITSFIAASLIRTHPIFLIIFIIVLLLMIVLSAMFSNIYQTAAMDSSLSTQANQLVFTSLIMNNLPIIIGIFGVIMVFIIYKVWTVEV